MYCFCLLPQLGLQCCSQKKQQWQRGRRRWYSVTSRVSILRNWPWRGSSWTAPTSPPQVWAPSTASAQKWPFTIQMAPTVSAVASHCTPRQWGMESYASCAWWSTRPTAGRTTGLLHWRSKVGFHCFFHSLFKLWFEVSIHIVLHTLLYVTWISPILFPAAPSQPLYSAVTLIAVTSVVSLLLVTSIIGGTLLLYRYFHKGMYKCEQSACFI